MSLASKLLVIFTTAILLVFGVPNFLAALWAAVGEETIHAMSNGKTATPEQIEDAIEFHHAALTIAPRAKTSADLAYLYMARDQSPESYQVALDALEESVKLEPVSAYRWLTLSAALATFPGQTARGCGSMAHVTCFVGS